ncbi:alpha/beta-hydrolase [Hysterangium stoloniferum]|nr:alpha/beta-hydrolase [Hysterangium stoloniferum]
MNSSVKSRPPASYLQPEPRTLVAEEPCHLRPLIPLRPPSQQANKPPASAVPKPSSTALPGYVRTSHIVPAAVPRTLPPDSKLREAALNSPEIIDAKPFTRGFIDKKLLHETPKAQASERGRSEAVLWNCVDRYVPIEGQSQHRRAAGKGITLFLTHAIGFPRQVWEPTLKHLLSLLACQGHSGVFIDEIWSFEAVQHGDSGVINNGNRSDIFDWQDHVRDINNFLVHYMPEEITPGTLPTFLDYVSGPTSRRVVGLGQSIGGAAISLAAVTHPKLFSSLVLIDPLIVPKSYEIGSLFSRLLRNTLRKPARWPSRRAAMTSLQKLPGTKSWDPAVIESYVRHGTIDSTAGAEGETSLRMDTPVHLKLHPTDEIVALCEWLVPHEAWTELKALDPQMALHWIMSGDSSQMTGGFAMTQATVWRRPANSSNVCLPGVGHLVWFSPPPLSFFW